MAGAAFADASTECAICLSPLDDGENETITLSCGHRWHLACLEEQLRSAAPSKSKRLAFSGCRCAKCGAFCDHPKLENLTRRTDALREKVDGLVAEQLRADAPDAWREAVDDPAAKAKLVDEGRRSYAFYLCEGCDEPYFGGTVQCADEVEGEKITSEDRLCQSCSPKSQAVCRHAFEHRPFHVWKCRYCCNPSTFVCYGNVHFCDGCHERNTQLVQSRSRGLVANATTLEGIPCRGEGCPHPKPEGSNKHNNGPTLDCEQVYSCAWCDSSPSRYSFVQTPGSRNLIVNPSGGEGSRGWQPHPSSRGRWSVEAIEVPVDGTTRTNFVSTFQWCVMSQTVPLHRCVRRPSAARLEVSAKFMGRTDCPSVFRMEATVTDPRRRVLRRVGTPTLTAPADFWERATLTIEPVEGAHEVTAIVYGKDSRFWRGNFGSKVCHCSVRVLGAEDELRDALLPGNIQALHERRPNYGFGNRAAFEVFLPVLVIIFLWLIFE